MENKLVIGILNIVEDKLREFGIMLPADERENSTDPIVGYHYAELHDRIQEYLEEEGLVSNRSEAPSKPKKPMKIKVVLDEGIVHDVLKDENEPVQVEVIDVNKDYEDYEELEDYKASIYADPSYKRCDYTVAHFEKGDYELSTPPLTPDLTLREKASLEDLIDSAESRKKEASSINLNEQEREVKSF